MSKRSNALDSMPSVVLVHLRELGENLAVARKRRREPLKAWAQRIGVSEPTLMRMEKGDPSVSMGVYATALWLVGRSQAIADLAAPAHDQGALEEAVRVAKARAVRKRPSLYGAAQAPNSLQHDAAAEGKS
jgi:DNA-binding XRE family transcriptional regulator